MAWNEPGGDKKDPWGNKNNQDGPPDLDEIVKKTGITKKEVERIRQMRVKSQHKRRSPLIPKIGIRTPGLDWRSPIIEG